MESALLMLDVLAIAVLVFTSLKNDRLRPDQPITGPFRFTTHQDSKRGTRVSGAGGRNDVTSLSAMRRK